jgi:hypothetical protein
MATARSELLFDEVASGRDQADWELARGFGGSHEIVQLQRKVPLAYDVLP